MFIQDTSLAHPMEQRIAWAEYCYTQLKEKLLGDPKLHDLLGRLRVAITDSHREMGELGIGDFCKACEEKEGGSCCGAGLEDHYSGTLLLINLLLGKDIPSEREEYSSCLFLSRKGCQLLARHVLCVNYLCKKMTDRFTPQELSSLREKEGVELELVFLLNEGIKKVLARPPTPA